MIYTWNEVGINEFTNLFLYGAFTKPTDLTSDNLIHPEDEEIEIDMSAISFMKDGPGRFAHGSQCSVVYDFMKKTIIPANGKRQEFSLERAMQLTNKKDSDRISIWHHNYSVHNNDHAFRTYLYESAGFKIADGVIFVVEADGSNIVV